ncbi:MAG: hypothetical protein MUO76_09105 [Anaerolineaceae bacterium]|nr:hypothetical protein [Anaerolineaceae bacterium]
MMNTSQNRIGFHYYPDTIHYREQDLNYWLPKLEEMHVSWLVLIGPMDRAIPEPFIRGLVNAGIEPVIHFQPDLSNMINAEELKPILSSYTRWGIKKVIFFDRPNIRASWSPKSWTKSNLVEQFLDQFLIYANLALENGLNPILPPFQPGGDYWDTVFLQKLLEMIKDRKLGGLIAGLTLSAYAWTGKHSLNWGAGGPQKWSKTRPYNTPSGEQNHAGFRIFDWYNPIIQKILHKKAPILLLGVGLPDDPDSIEIDPTFHDKYTENVLSTLKLLNGEIVWDPEEPQKQLESIPEEVFSCCFWMLSAEPDSPYHEFAWFQERDLQLPVVEKYNEWLQNVLEAEKQNRKTFLENESTKKKIQSETEEESQNNGQDQKVSKEPIEKDVGVDQVLKRKNGPQNRESHETCNQNETQPTSSWPKETHTETQKIAGGFNRKKLQRPIAHYLLLPTYEWGVADWHLEIIQPFVKKYRPTIGFSLKEAVLANRVTVIGNQQSFSDEIIDRLQAAGCEVERISGDGTTIATRLAER